MHARVRVLMLQSLSCLYKHQDLKQCGGVVTCLLRKEDMNSSISFCQAFLGHRSMFEMKAPMFNTVARCKCFKSRVVDASNQRATATYCVPTCETCQSGAVGLLLLLPFQRSNLPPSSPLTPSQGFVARVGRRLSGPAPPTCLKVSARATDSPGPTDKFGGPPSRVPCRHYVRFLDG